MNRLTKSIIEHLPNPIFSVHDLAVLEPSAANIRHALVKRAVAGGDLIIIRRGLYALSPVYRKTALNTFSAAQQIYGPSYISLESALSAHSWIPEGVRDIVSVTCRLSRDFDTPIGHFSYIRVPQKTLFAGIKRVTNDAGISWLMATPLKALADYVYFHRLGWTSLEPLIKSLRIEEELLAELVHADFDELEDNYTSLRVRRFLRALKKDVLP
jgi:predicted transcriptional regulator of viral defense system